MLRDWGRARIIGLGVRLQRSVLVMVGVLVTVGARIRAGSVDI